MMITFQGESLGDLKVQMLEFVKTLDIPTTIPSVSQDDHLRGEFKGEEPPFLSPVTKDDVVFALEKVSREKGIKSVKDLLEEFQCKKLSDLGEKNYVPFISACQKVISS